MSIRYRLFKLRQKFSKKIDPIDLKPGTMIETFKGISTIVDIGQSLVSSTMFSPDDELEWSWEPSYICDTHYTFDDESDRFFYEDILKIVGFNEDWEKLKEVCPNPDGESGKCYSFDRFGDRTGCLGCPLADTIPGGIFDKGDPLPGLTKQLEEVDKTK